MGGAAPHAAPGRLLPTGQPRPGRLPARWGRCVPRSPRPPRFQQTEHTGPRGQAGGRSRERHGRPQGLCPRSGFPPTAGSGFPRHCGDSMASVARSRCSREQVSAKAKAGGRYRGAGGTPVCTGVPRGGEAPAARAAASGI
uniref:Uncharacterized protein n=1 Tax=Rousettus aegyptiacus TaxID=9407 RepID=A0A7J8BF38_ROUAE|nr:hypothetical protein HJG63_009766 [Rousettus aegyptiacus]